MRVKTGIPDFWVVYDHPRDWPMGFVARRFQDGEPCHEAVVAGEVEQIREHLCLMGLARLAARAESDEPQIVETWI